MQWKHYSNTPISCTAVETKQHIHTYNIHSSQFKTHGAVDMLTQTSSWYPLTTCMSCGHGQYVISVFLQVRHAPHVISCYTAGARLIGLNDKQLERQLRKMQKAAKNEKSPYAKPLPFVTVDKKKHKKNTSGTKSVSTGGRKKTAVEPQQKPAGPDIEEVMDTKSSIHSEPDTTKHPAAHQTDGRSFIDMTCDVDPKEAENRQKMESTARRTAVTPDSINEDLLVGTKYIRIISSTQYLVPLSVRNPEAMTSRYTQKLCTRYRSRWRPLGHIWMSAIVGLLVGL